MGKVNKKGMMRYSETSNLRKPLQSLRSGGTKGGNYIFRAQ